MSPIWLRFLVPVSLTTLRLALAPATVLLAVNQVEGWPYPLILVTALMSDLFDGVFARRLGVSRPWVRRYDSATDVVFYLSVCGALWILREAIIWEYLGLIAAVLSLEFLCNAISLIRNGSLPATHTLLAKIWAVLLALTFAVVLGWGAAWPLLDMTLIYGIVVDLEVIGIIVLTPGPAVDVLTIFHAWRLRRSTKG